MRLPGSVLRQGVIVMLAAGIIGLMLWPSASRQDRSIGD
jgi:hypothetical protein